MRHWYVVATSSSPGSKLLTEMFSATSGSADVPHGHAAPALK
jgi:hypothetical protein